MRELFLNYKRSKNKKSTILLSLFVLYIVTLFVSNRSVVVNEFFYSLSVTQLVDLSFIFKFLLIPAQVISEIFKMVSFVCVIEIAVTFSIIVFVPFFKVIVKYFHILKHENEIKSNEFKSVRSNRLVYKENLRFLC